MNYKQIEKWVKSISPKLYVVKETPTMAKIMLKNGEYIVLDKVEEDHQIKGIKIRAFPHDKVISAFHAYHTYEQRYPELVGDKIIFHRSIGDLWRKIKEHGFL